MTLPLLATGTFGQVFTLRHGRTQVASGTHSGVNALYCHEDGSLSISFPEGDETHTFVAGDCFGFGRAVAVTITSGTWSFM